MDTYSLVKKRILDLCYEKRISVNKLATASGLSASTVKNIIYGKSTNPGIVTIKILCDGLDISLTDFFNTDDFKNLEQEIK